MLIRHLYTSALLLAMPLVVLWLTYRGLRDRRYREGWTQRLALETFPAADVWLHAASVGEVQAAVPLLKALLKADPDLRVLVTTVTPTGAERLAATLGEAVIHRYLPLDLPVAVNRFFEDVRPGVGVVMEVELWPNLLHAARGAGVPLVLANGRLSQRSLDRYRRLGGLIRGAVSAFATIAAQSAEDAARLGQLAGDDTHVFQAGNVKFDLTPPADLAERAGSIRRLLQDRPVWVAGSTRDGEEAMLLQAHETVCARLPEAVLIVVPRHPERFDAVARLAEGKGWGVSRRSFATALSGDQSVMVGDSMGELMAYYDVGSAAFVGGTLVAVGGHNVLEPAALGKPVVVGPHGANILEPRGLLRQAGALRVVEDAESLGSVVAEWLVSPERAEQAGQAGRAVVEANRGAVERIAGAIAAKLQDPGSKG